MKSGKRDDLSHITRIDHVLRGLRHEEVIQNFLFRGLKKIGAIYKIVISEERFFDLILCEPRVLKPQGGIEFVKGGDRKVLAVVNKYYPTKDKNYFREKIREEIFFRVKELTDGLGKEQCLEEHLKELVENDQEVRRVIASIVPVFNKSEEYERGIDRWIVLQNGKKVPIQVKSSITGQVEHRHRYPKIPSIIYAKEYNKNGILKKCILQIVESYFRNPQIIEHLSMIKK